MKQSFFFYSPNKYLVWKGLYVACPRFALVAFSMMSAFQQNKTTMASHRQIPYALNMKMNPLLQKEFYDLTITELEQSIPLCLVRP